MLGHFCLHKSRWIACLVILVAAGSISAQDVCMQSIGGLGGVPTLDGLVTGDFGWNNAVQLNLSGDLGSTTASKLLLGRAAYHGQDSLFVGLISDGPSATQQIDPDTTLILTFSTDNVAANDWRIFITPIDPDPNNQRDGSSQMPFSVTYWRNSDPTTGWNQPGVTATNWSLDNVQFSKSGTHWELEFVIPIANPPNGICFGCNNANSFKIYANILNTAFGQPTGSTGQDVWPPCPKNAVCGSILPSGPITQTTPTSGNWGIVWLANAPQNACTGVSLSWDQVGIEDPLHPGDPGTPLLSLIRRYSGNIPDQTVTDCKSRADNYQPGDWDPQKDPQNVFVARPVNNMAATTAQVSVTFNIAHWGIPAAFPAGLGAFVPLGYPVQPVPPVPPGCDPTIIGATMCAGVKNNPTSPPTPINPAGSTANINSTAWTMNYKQSCLYKVNEVNGETHECIQVNMDSGDPNTRLLNRSVQRNMDIVPASTFRRTAYISGDQGPLPAGKSKHRFLLEVDVDEQRSCAEGAKEAPVNPIERNTSLVSTTGGCRHLRDQQLVSLTRKYLGRDVDNFLSWIVRGYVYTGNKIIINGHEYEYVRRVGDFGYVAGHKGPITGWNWQFEGDKSKDGFKQIGPNLYTLEAAPGTEAKVGTTITAKEPKVAVFLDAGAGIPNGVFGNAFNTGFSLNAGLEYMFNPRVSAEGIFGYHHFGAKTVGDLNLYQFSADAKVYLIPSGPNRPYIEGGIGAYKFSPGPTKFGGNAGAGLLRELTAHWGLQGSYHFHAVSTPGAVTKFSTVQGGIRYVF